MNYFQMKACAYYSYIGKKLIYEDETCLIFEDKAFKDEDNSYIITKTNVWYRFKFVSGTYFITDFTNETLYLIETSINNELEICKKYNMKYKLPY